MAKVKVLKKKFQLDRAKFLNYYPTVVYEMSRQPKVLDAMVKGNEFILTAEDVLQTVGYVSGKLLGVNAPVHFSNIILTYTPDYISKDR